MEFVVENELILDNIFSWMTLSTIKKVRFVNRKWNKIAAHPFSELSRVTLRLHQSNEDMLRPGQSFLLEIRINHIPIWKVGIDDDITTIVGTQLQNFKHFVVDELVSRKQDMAVVYRHLDKLVRCLWRPSASIRYTIDFDKYYASFPGRKELIFSIVDGLNAYSSSETHLRNDYNFIDGLKFKCTSLIVWYQLDPSNIKNILPYFINVKKFTFGSGKRIVANCADYIVQNPEQFANLEEVEVNDCSDFDEVNALSRLPIGLKKLIIDISAFKICRYGRYEADRCELEYTPSDYACLENSLMKHATTLKSLQIIFLQSKVVPGYKLRPIDFPNLKSLSLKMNGIFQHSAVSYSASDRDFLDISGSLKSDNFRNRFPQLSFLHVTLPIKGSPPILGREAILRLKKDRKLNLKEST